MSPSLAKSLSLSLGLFLTSVAAIAQSNPTPVSMPNAVATNQPNRPLLDGRTLYRYVSKMPMYADGGKDGLQTFISGHVQGATSGSGAFVTFIVDQTGKVRRPALGGAPAESEAAVAPTLATAFTSIGTFKPGYQNGKPVDVQLTMRIAGPLQK